MKRRNGFIGRLLLWLVLPLTAVSGNAQVVGHFNQIEGTIELTNTNPVIVEYLEGNSFKNVHVWVQSTGLPVALSSDAAGSVTGLTTGEYQLTVEAGADGEGIEYEAWSRIRLQNNHEFWIYRQPIGVVEEKPAPSTEHAFKACPGMVRAYFKDETGEPLHVRNPRFHFGIERDVGSGTYWNGHWLYNGSGAESVGLAPAFDSRNTRIRIQYQILATDDSTWIWQDRYHTEIVDCDEVIDLTFNLTRPDYNPPPPPPPPPPAGTLTGYIDMVNEDEVRSSWLRYFNNIPGPYPAPFSGNFSPGRRHFYSQYYVRENWDFSFLRSPTLYNVETESEMTTDIGNAFVIDPGYIRGDINVAGPFPVSGESSCLEKVYRFVDTNGDGIPDSQGYTSSLMQANGVNSQAPGATYTARDAHSQTYFQGDFEGESASFLGSYEHVVGGLYGESTYWSPRYFRLSTYDDSTPEEPDAYLRNNMWIQNYGQESLLVNPGEAVEADWDLCVSEVRLGFSALGGEFYNPYLVGEGRFIGTDFLGNPANYQASSLGANGTPITLGTAASKGQVNLCLPQGDYTLTPGVTAVNPNGTTNHLKLPPISFTVGCRQILDLKAEVQAQIDEIPACAASDTLTVTGSASASDTVNLLTSTVNGTDSTLCTDCGQTVDFSFDTTLNACANEIAVTAEDRLDNTATARAFTRLDFDAPVLSGCEDVEVTVEPEEEEVFIDFGTLASDGCDGSRPVVCDHPLDGPFRPGTTDVTCTATDVCGNASTCSFSVTVNNGATSECVPDDFSDTDLDPAWNFANLGDADEGSVQVIRDQLHVRGDGTSLFHGDDNAGFAYQEMSGDFRVTVDVVDIPGDQGGDVRKAALMVRSGTGPNDPRIMVTYVPHFPTDPETTALQFDFRDTNGNAFELAGRDLDIPLPVKLAIERRGVRFTVNYSTDGGETWIQPQGDFGGTIDLDMGDTVLAGVAVSSYDADTVMTAAFDNFDLCSPNLGGPFEPGDPASCDGLQPADVIYLVDRSSSMTHEYGGLSRFEATRRALRDVNDLLDFHPIDHRAALITFGGTEDGTIPEVTVHSGLTNDLASIGELINDLEAPTATPLRTTPTARALRTTLQTLLAEHDPNNQPVLVWFTDGVPNMDILGRGPDAYGLHEIQNMSLMDDYGDFLPWGTVAWQGNFNVDTGTYDGEPMANAMYEMELLKTTFGDLLMYGIALQGNSVDFGTFNEDLLAYGAYVTGTPYFSTDNLASLSTSIEGLLDELVCGDPATALLGDRVWSDLDQNGLQNGGEPGIEGVTVELIDGIGEIVATATTDAAGAFVFANLEPGTWTLRVDPSTLPGDFLATFDGDGIGSVDTVTVNAGAWDVRRDLDFGYYELPPDPLANCFVDAFDDDVLDPSWSTASIGDDSLGFVNESGGVLEIGSDGSALWGSDHYFHLFQNASGNFRVEVDLTGVTQDVGGTFRKAGLVVSSGNAPDSPRVMVQYVPHFPNPDRAVLQFGYRDTAGGGGQLLAEVVPVYSPLPVRLAIEKVGNTYTAYYSTNGGDTWVQPTDGGAGGSVTFDMGDDLRVGLGAASYQNGTVFAATLDEFLLCPLDP